MPQYTGSATTGTGIVTTAVLNTESNTITYTMVAPDGTTATNTQDASLGANDSENVTKLVRQLQANNVNVGSPRDFTNALKTATNDVKDQAAKADAAAKATNTPVPENPLPTPPTTPPSTNPEPSTNNTPSETPQVTPANDPFEQQRLEAETRFNEREAETFTPQEITSEDPFEQQRIEAEQQLNRDELASEEQAAVGNEDPFEAQRLEAEQRLNEDTPITFPENIGPEDPFEAQRLEAEQALNRQELLREEAGGVDPNTTNITGALQNARETATKDDAEGSNKTLDWRVKISLAPGAKYLYKGIPVSDTGILAPLAATDGVIFPYTPSINISYAANYDATELTHSNYKIYQYKSSNVDSIQITGDFTAQDSKEANYLLAVIHFFRSVTKMFYGKDENPSNGTPPPLCYLTGLGNFQFNNHPMVITNFSYQMPTDVDYIRATSMTTQPGVTQAGNGSNVLTNDASANRLAANNLVAKAPNFQRQQFLINSEATYVPTKMQISITAFPIVSRNDISNNFSLKKYATGSLLKRTNGGGIW